VLAEKAGRPYEYFESPVRTDPRARAIAAHVRDAEIAQRPSHFAVERGGRAHANTERDARMCCAADE
jgi:hypothetical protein